MFSSRLLPMALLILSMPVFQQAPAKAQAVRVSAQPAFAKFRTVNPSFIPNLAAIRQINIRVNHAGGLKNRLVKKHIRSTFCPNDMARTEDQIETADDDSIASQFIPISFATRSVAAFRSGPVGTIETDTARAWARTFVAVDGLEASPDKVFLAKDNQVLVFSKVDHEFQIDQCKVTLKRGALILVSKLTTGFRLINLKDECRDAVKICSPSASISVKPGTEADFEGCHRSAKPRLDGIGRRNKITQCDCGDCKLNVSEVSIHSVLLNNNLANYLYNSDNKAERKLGEQTLKMAAALAHMNRSSAEYTWK
ncbi:MAG: hypothetical protein K2X77_19005 [Candidatus Obscuribacterales bacterium]|jgi:hypothetical protein|nr:hypothetical protein [Candidatus Obscuribacterales bacterium]